MRARLSKSLVLLMASSIFLVSLRGFMRTQTNHLLSSNVDSMYLNLNGKLVLTISQLLLSEWR
jgi:hypothetical protein